MTKTPRGNSMLCVAAMPRDWPRPDDPLPESRIVIGGCAVLIAIAIAIMLYSSIAPFLTE